MEIVDVLQHVLMTHTNVSCVSTQPPFMMIKLQLILLCLIFIMKGGVLGAR